MTALNNIFITVGIFAFSILVTFLLTRYSANKKISEYKSIKEALNSKATALEETNNHLAKSQDELKILNDETSELQELKLNADNIANDLSANTVKLDGTIATLNKTSKELENKEIEIHDLLSKLDLYSRLDEFVEVGHYETPAYLYETSERFAQEIKRVREQQKELIKSKEAITCDATISFGSNATEGKRVLNGQVKLMLNSFNVEADSLIGKVSPSSFPRTLERIEKLANTIEKSSLSFHCGFNIEYVELKFEECRLQYQYSLKKKEEQDEQKLIKEQQRDEQRAIKEYEKALAEAVKEERLYRSLLEKARKQLDTVSDEEKLIAQVRIQELEEQLAEAESKEARAKSMAEQTKKGHVYVISNIGSFGEEVYKIGLTRRLEPMDRVKELGDASVPFTFDVHAMIYVDDAPALERALHKEFTHKRVNAVNLRKEFFRTDLISIKDAVEKVAGIDAEFKTTVLAEEYFESRRLQENN